MPCIFHAFVFFHDLPETLFAPLKIRSCIMNCKELVDPRNKLAVEGSCANCSAEDDVSYRWILYEKNAMSWLEVSDLRQRTSTSAESRFLGLKKRMLDGGKSYKLVLHAWKGRRRG